MTTLALDGDLIGKLKDTREKSGSLIEQYFQYQREYEEKYGQNTIVLMQIGSFYEIFGYDPEFDETENKKEKLPKRVGNAAEASFILNMVLTRQNKNEVYTYNNPNKVGFPTIAYEKHKDKLLAAEYTIVVIDQFKNKQPAKSNANKLVTVVEREVTSIVSPATEINNISSLPVSNQIVSVYIECQKSQKIFQDYLVTCGVSTIDISTGQNIVGEIYSKEENPIHAIHEIYRFLTSHSPREVIFNVSGIAKDKEEAYSQYLTTTFELAKYPTVVIRCNDVSSDYMNIHYQSQMLNKIFRARPNNKVKLELVGSIQDTSILEKLGLETLYYGSVSYILLLQYCYEHNETIVQKIKNPNTTWIDEKHHLILTHNALQQLDICSHNNRRSKRKGLPAIDSLFSVIDQTSTAMGKRYLKNSLANPITSVEKLQKRYDCVDALMQQTDIITSIENILKRFPDIERYQRKLVLHLIQPHEFSILFKAYIKVVTLYSTIVSAQNMSLNNLLFGDPHIGNFNKCLQAALSCFDLSKLEKCKIEDNEVMDFIDIFTYPGLYPDLDKQSHTLKIYQEKLNNIVEHLNSFLGSTRGKRIQVEAVANGRPTINNNGNPGPTTYLGLMTTDHKAKVLIRQVSDIDSQLCGHVKTTKHNKKTLMQSGVIDNLCLGIEHAKTSLKQKLYEIYMAKVKSLAEYTCYSVVDDFISKVDFIKSGAKSAIKYRYFKPVLDTEHSGSSYFEAKDLRHPVSERLISTEYVPNDISLGKDPLGVLLYGTNASGKTTLAKAIGLSIILAQIGYFTPGYLKYKPYHKIITRLSGNDDLIKGQSSFVVEMSELRTILRDADDYTLVLGDELSRGSEIFSSSSLTIATLLTLIKRKASFIFSTHLHNITQTEYLQTLAPVDLRVCHLTTVYDENSKTLVYDRKLKNGQGETVYGLEVARYIGLDKDFMTLADKIRRNIMGLKDQLYSTNKSRYNSRVYMDNCAVCGKDSNLHTHHIKEQKLADKEGFIGHMHKNSAFNLVVLCQNCHVQLHKDMHLNNEQPK